jgi:hypothetical protein
MRTLLSAREGTVAAAFERGLLLEFDTGLVCLLGRSMSPGPLNALLTSDIDRPAPVVGTRVRVAADFIHIIGWASLSFTAACMWQTPAWRPPAAPATVAARINTLCHEAADRVPTDGIAGLVLGQHSCSLPLAKRAATGIAALTSFLRRSFPLAFLAQGEREAVAGLLGLGPGLTPSGDDLLAGALTALAATGEQVHRDALGRLVLDRASELTSPYSAALLAAAAEGDASALWHGILTCLLGPCECDTDSLLDAVDGIGHTSGWDMLAGAIIALQGYGARSNREQALARDIGCAGEHGMKQCGEAHGQA